MDLIAIKKIIIIFAFYNEKFIVFTLWFNEQSLE